MQGYQLLTLPRTPDAPFSAQLCSAWAAAGATTGSCACASAKCSCALQASFANCDTQRTHNHTQCLGSGWRFPWGLRVRLCEMLLRGVFDTLEEGAYIAEADEYLQLLQVGAGMAPSCVVCVYVRV